MQRSISTIKISFLLISLGVAPAFAGKSSSTPDLSCGTSVAASTSSSPAYIPYYTPFTTTSQIPTLATVNGTTLSNSITNLGKAATACGTGTAAYKVYAGYQSDCSDSQSQKNKNKHGTRWQNCVTEYDTWVTSTNSNVDKANLAGIALYVKQENLLLPNLNNNCGAKCASFDYNQFNNLASSCQTLWNKLTPAVQAKAAAGCQGPRCANASGYTTTDCPS